MTVDGQLSTVNRQLISGFFFRLKFLISLFSLLTGIAIFLLGMNMLEEALRTLAGRPFKLFLRKHTASSLKALGSGALVTAVMQSSSVVNMLVLAFAGAGVLQMANALAITIGANLGTTVSNWLILTVGFKLSLEAIAYPFAGIAGIFFALTNPESAINRWAKMLFGFGFLFVGLGLIKSGMESSMNTIDLKIFEQYGSFVYLLLGFVITTILQSSSANMAIVLSALATGAIGFIPAMAIVLGGEIGTTIKLLIASVRGSAVKKRVALGNFLYNTFFSLLFWIVLKPVSLIITESLRINDPLLGLVLFQTFVNLGGIILFFPFLKPFGRFLENRFTRQEEETLFIHKSGFQDAGLAMGAVEKELKHFLLEAISYTRMVSRLHSDPRIEDWLNNRDKTNNHAETRYEELKHLHGEIQQYLIRLQKALVPQNQFWQQWNQFNNTNRNTLYACKSIKDASLDMEILKKSSNDIKFEFYRDAVRQADEYCLQMTALLLELDPKLNDLISLYKNITENYSLKLQSLYKEGMFEKLDEIEITTLINFHREMFTGYKSFLFALKDYLLNEKDAQYFEELPGFIR